MWRWLFMKRKYCKDEAIIEAMNAGTWEWNVQTGDLVINDRWASMVGYTLKELEPVSIKTWEALIHPDDLKTSNRLLEKVFNNTLKYYSVELRMRHRDGHYIWILDSGSVLKRTDDGQPLIAIGTHIDITHRRALQEKLAQSEENLKEILKHTKDIIYRISPDNTLIYLSDSWETQLGYTIEEALNQSFNPYLHPKDKGRLKDFFKSINHNNHYHTIKDFRLKHQDGTYHYFETTAKAIVENNTLKSYIGLLRDVTKEVENQRYIEYLSYHDQLTNFYNRHYLEKSINKIIDKNNYPLCVISIDVNYLKNVNDTYGHQTGDELLVKSAQIIRDNVTVKDYLFRIGGDEFLIFLPNTNDEGALEIREKINRAIEVLRGNEFPLSLAYGFHTKTNPEVDIFEAIKRADYNMYEDKKKHRQKDFRSLLKSPLYT